MTSGQPLKIVQRHMAHPVYSMLLRHQNKTNKPVTVEGLMISMVFSGVFISISSLEKCILYSSLIPFVPWIIKIIWCNEKFSYLICI